MLKNKTKLIPIASVFILALFTLAPHSVFAVQPSDKPTKEERMEGLEAKKAEQAVDRAEKRCEIRQNRLEKTIDMFGRTQRFHMEKFRRLEERLTNLMTRFDEAGLDTTQLTDYLTTLDTMLDDLETQYADFMAALQAMLDEPCNTEDPALPWNNNLEEIKGMLLDLRTSVMEIKDYLVKTIKPELVDLKQQLPEDSSEENSETTESSE